MTSPTALEDRLAIRELIDRWSDAVNNHDWVALGTCFTEDGLWDVGPPYGFRIEGNQAITSIVSEKISEQAFVVQIPHAVVITLNGDTATARSTINEFMRDTAGQGMTTWATYYDVCVRTPAGWRFSVRRFEVTLFDATPPAGELLRTFG